MERFGFVFLVAGLGFFALAFVVSGVLPWIQFKDLPVVTVQDLARDVPLEFAELREQYPEAFTKAFGDKTDSEALAEAIVLGRKAYIGEGCWHCHSQQVRPWGGDEARFGRVSYPKEYNNDMNYPVLWGTRRIGPDLARQSGKHSNDWHVAHFWNPRDVSPTSVMPRYPWFYEADGKTPNKRGLSVIAYVQWLGSWETNYSETVFGTGMIERGYTAPPARTDLVAKPPPSAVEQPATSQPSDDEY